MAIFFPISGGLQILNDSPVDSRYVVADQTARLGLPAAVVFKGLLVFQADTAELYVLEDISQADHTDGWTQVDSNGIDSIEYTNGELIFTLEDGTIDRFDLKALRDDNPIVNNGDGTYTFHFADGDTFTTEDFQAKDIVSGVANDDGTITFTAKDDSTFTTTGDLTGPQGLQGPGRFTVYQVGDDSTTPSVPAPTSYNISEDFSSTNGQPAGWTITPDSPATGQATYAITVLYDAIDAVDGSVLLTWSNVFIAGSAGPSGPAGVSITGASVPDDGANEGHLVLTRDQGQADIITTEIVAGDKELEMVQVAGQVFFRGERGDGTAFENGPFDFAGVGSDETITEWDRNALYDVGHVVFQADATSIQLYRWNDTNEEAGVQLTDSRWDKILDTDDLATDTELTDGLALKLDKPAGTPEGQGYAGHFISVDSSGNTNAYGNDTIHLSDLGAIEIAREFIARPGGVDGDNVFDITTTTTTIHNDAILNNDLTVRATDAADILVVTSGADLASFYSYIQRQRDC